MRAGWMTELNQIGLHWSPKMWMWLYFIKDSINSCFPTKIMQKECSNDSFPMLCSMIEVWEVSDSRKSSKGAVQSVHIKHMLIGREYTERQTQDQTQTHLETLICWYVKIKV